MCVRFALWRLAVGMRTFPAFAKDVPKVALLLEPDQEKSRPWQLSYTSGMQIVLLWRVMFLARFALVFCASLWAHGANKVQYLYTKVSFFSSTLLSKPIQIVQGKSANFGYGSVPNERTCERSNEPPE